jgi:anhydro-N-acetylmuramic acid kinase
MVIDAVTAKLFGKAFDRDGRIAASGKVMGRIVNEIMRQAFFRQKPPKTAGREEFGREFVEKFIGVREDWRPQDVVATATALTAKSIADAVGRHVVGKLPIKKKFHEMVLSGGGAKNPTLMAMLENELAPTGIRLRLCDEFGVPSEAKEAVAFALLAHETWHRRPSNLPSATGAKRAAVLGKISYP